MREQLIAAEKVRAVEWREGSLWLLDQRGLPQESRWLCCDSVEDVAEAIRDLVVSGSSVVAIAAAFGVLMAVRQRMAAGDAWREALEQDFLLLEGLSGGVVSLSWALDRMRSRLQRTPAEHMVLQAMEDEAHSIYQADREANLAIAQLGLELICKHGAGPQKFITHSYSGALAGGGFGTALGVIRAAHQGGLVEQVFVDEMRPGLQGARLTAWELESEGVPVRVNIDAAAGHLMKSGEVSWVVVGADRISANGDVAYKMGTYQLAVNAMHHGVRVMVVALSSCIDMGLVDGDCIDLEGAAQVVPDAVGGSPLAMHVELLHPVLDVTPADLIDAIVTERGVVEQPNALKIELLMSPRMLH